MNCEILSVHVKKISVLRGKTYEQKIVVQKFLYTDISSRC